LLNLDWLVFDLGMFYCNTLDLYPFFREAESAEPLTATPVNLYIALTADMGKPPISFVRLFMRAFFG
jgi:hypothetical protein